MVQSSTTSTTTTKRLKTLNEVPLYTAIIVVLEYLFLSLPNVSLTPLLFAVYFSARSYRQSMYVITIYMLVEILQWGVSLWVVPMWIGWILWMVIVKRCKNDICLPVAGAIFAYLYGALFMPLTVIIYGVDWWGYLVADFPFATTMALGNVLTLSLLHKRLTNLLTSYE